MASFHGTMINPQRFSRTQIKFYIIVLPIVLVMSLPILFIINHAFKPFDELFNYPPTFFVQRPTLDNFINLGKLAAQSGIPFSRYLFNSLFVTALSIILTLMVSTFAAFSFTFTEYRFKNVIFKFNQIALMFVPIAVAIPRYLIIANMQIIDTYLAHIVPMLAVPVGIFLLRQFMSQIPNELIDAAKVDGANLFQIYWRVVVPLVMPAIATVGILIFQSVWNNIDTSSLYINNAETLRTLPFFVQSIIQNTGNVVAGTGMSAASSLIMFVPNLVIFILLQGKVLNTMAHSGIK